MKNIAVEINQVSQDFLFGNIAMGTYRFGWKDGG